MSGVIDVSNEGLPSYRHLGVDVDEKTVWLGIMSILLGIVLAFQLKLVQKNYLNGLSPTQKSAEIIAELNN